MKCKKCGKKVPQGAHVCPYCRGSEFEEGEKIGKKFASHKKAIIIAASICLVLLVGFLISWNVYFKYTKINIDKYVDLVKSEDEEDYMYNGCGHYDAILDEDKLVDDIYYSAGGEKYSKKEIKVAIDDKIKIKDGDDNGKLFNGDKYKVKVKYSNSVFHRYGIHLTGGEKTKKVKGLEKTEELDPFDGAEMITKGASPNIRVAIINKKHEDLKYRYLIDGEETETESMEEDDYHLPEENEWSMTVYEKGAEVKVTLDSKVYFEGDKAYLLTNDKHTYKIEKTPTLLTSTENLNKKTMANIIERGEELIGNCIEMAGYIENYDLTYKGAYLWVGDNENVLDVVYRIEHDDGAYAGGDGYVDVSFSDVSFDGTKICEGVDPAEPFTENASPDEDGDAFLYEFIQEKVKYLYEEMENTYGDRFKPNKVGDL